MLRGVWWRGYGEEKGGGLAVVIPAAEALAIAKAISNPVASSSTGVSSSSRSITHRNHCKHGHPPGGSTFYIRSGISVIPPYNAPRPRGADAGEPAHCLMNFHARLHQALPSPVQVVLDVGLLFQGTEMSGDVSSRDPGFLLAAGCGADGKTYCLPGPNAVDP